MARSRIQRNQQMITANQPNKIIQINYDVNVCWLMYILYRWMASMCAALATNRLTRLQDNAIAQQQSNRNQNRNTALTSGPEKCVMAHQRVHLQAIRMTLTIFNTNNIFESCLLVPSSGQWRDPFATTGRRNSSRENWKTRRDLGNEFLFCPVHTAATTKHKVRQMRLHGRGLN